MRCYPKTIRYIYFEFKTYMPFDPGDECSRFLQNVGTYLTHCTMPHPTNLQLIRLLVFTLSLLRHVFLSLMLNYVTILAYTNAMDQNHS